MQEGAKHHVILVAVGRADIRDAFLGDNLMSMDFSMRDVLIVPYKIGLDDATKRTRPSSGFGNAPKWETRQLRGAMHGRRVEGIHLFRDEGCDRAERGEDR